MKKITIATIGSLYLFSTTYAAINITLEFEALRNNTGTPTNGMVYIFVAANELSQLPTATDLLGGRLAAGETFGNGSSIFHAATTASTFGNSGAAFVDLSNLDGANYTPTGTANNLLGDAPVGSQFGLYWFPTVTNLNHQLVGGENYGFYQTSSVDTASLTDTAMVLPGDSLTANIIYYDSASIEDITGNAPTANTPSVTDFSANFTVVPEPSAAILGLLGGVALFLRRRR